MTPSPFSGGSSGREGRVHRESSHARRGWGLATALCDGRAGSSLAGRSGGLRCVTGSRCGGWLPDASGSGRRSPRPPEAWLVRLRTRRAPEPAGVPWLVVSIASGPVLALVMVVGPSRFGVNDPHDASDQDHVRRPTLKSVLGCLRGTGVSRSGCHSLRHSQGERSACSSPGGRS